MRNPIIIILFLLCVAMSGCEHSDGVVTASTNNPRIGESDVESNSSLILATWSLADKTKVQARIDALDKNAQGVLAITV